MNFKLTPQFALPRTELVNQLGIKPDSKSIEIFDELLNKVEEVAQPKSMYRIAYVEDKDIDTVAIENVVFHSKTMRINLEKIHRVFPFLATCGSEVEEIRFMEGDILVQYWMNNVKLYLLRASIDYLVKTIQDRFLLNNLSIMNPGSGDSTIWPIEEQGELFELFGGYDMIEKEIGIKLLPSYWMTPEMSSSGILFPSEISYVNCQLCKREDCPSRRAEFDEVKWKSVQS